MFSPSGCQGSSYLLAQISWIQLIPHYESLTKLSFRAFRTDISLCTFHSQLGKREPVIALRDHFAVSEDVIKLSVLVQQRKKVKGGSQAIENDCKTSKSDCLEDWYVIP